MHPSRPSDRSPAARARLARLLAVLAVALTLVAIPAAMPSDASANQKGRRVSENTAIRGCLGAGGTISWQFYDDGIDADMTCRLPSGRTFFCIPVNGPFANIVDCIG